VKEALVQAKLNRYYSDIGFAVYGIAFFGTPHRGGNMVSLGGVASNVARAVVQNPKSNFMEAFKGEKSPSAESFVKKFRFLIDQYEILSFYKTRPFKKLSYLVVTISSYGKTAYLMTFRSLTGTQRLLVYPAIVNGRLASMQITATSVNSAAPMMPPTYR
jgi:hypothetical protein